jgi:simple sugar transport system ATP-binding protein
MAQPPDAIGTGEAGGTQGVAPIVALRGIVKRFGTFAANDGIDLDIVPGELHALLGENGAGKSTLVKILYGLLQPTEGEILWKGAPTVLASPAAARDRGIGMVFQHFSLFENLTVAENVAVALPKAWTLPDIARRIEAVGRDYGLTLEPDRPVWTLSAGERQRIEIVRCLLLEPRVLILDEPTSVLTPQEAERLFVTLERLAADGAAILYISHRLEEVRRLCSRATVLRAGKVVATLDPRAASAREIAAMMVGAEIGEVKAPGPHPVTRTQLFVDGLSLPARDLHGVALRDVRLAVAAGEIVGIAGIAGNGQGELFAALSGEDLSPQAGTIVICDVPAGRQGINERRALGAAFVAEERLGHGAVPPHKLSDNLVLTRHGLGGLSRFGFLKRRGAREASADIIRAFDVRVSVQDPAAGTLSGGNLQKFVMGRELTRQPKVLVVNQPTWGVDAAAAALIRQSLLNLAAGGAAVLVISQDLDELFEIADRIAVIHAGELSEARPAATLTREAVGLLMTGSDDMRGHHAA